MADLFLTWDEAQAEQLPHYCISCAAPATEWADWRICHSRHRVISIQYTYLDVTLPVCPRHRELNSFFLPRIVARQIHDDGVVLSHVAPGFVEAVWDYRNEMETQQAETPARSFSPPPPSFESDFEAYSPKSLTHRGYGQERYHRASPGWSLGKIVLIGIAVLLFAPCGTMLLIALLGLLIKLVIG